MSDALIARLVGGRLQAGGVLVILLGGLCTGWLVLPDVARSRESQGLLDKLYESWLPLAGGIMAVAIGILLARAGLRRTRSAGAPRSGDHEDR